jgi:hypothetical protein
MSEFYIIMSLKINASSKVLQNYTDSAFEQWYFSYRRFKWRLAPITNEIGRVMHSAHGTVVVPTIVSNDGRANMS